MAEERSPERARPSVEDNADALAKARRNVAQLSETLGRRIPEFPLGVSEPQQVRDEIEKFAQELHAVGWALVSAKMTLYVLERQKRATERALKGKHRGNAALISQLDMLNDVITDANNMRFAALDKMDVVKGLLGSLYQIKSAVTGGF